MIKIGVISNALADLQQQVSAMFSFPFRLNDSQVYWFTSRVLDKCLMIGIFSSHEPIDPVLPSMGN